MDIIKKIKELNAKVDSLQVEQSKLAGMHDLAKQRFEGALEAYNNAYGESLKGIEDINNALTALVAEAEALAVQLEAQLNAPEYVSEEKVDTVEATEAPVNAEAPVNVAPANVAPVTAEAPVNAAPVGVVGAPLNVTPVSAEPNVAPGVVPGVAPNVAGFNPLEAPSAAVAPSAPVAQAPTFAMPTVDASVGFSVPVQPASQVEAVPVQPVQPVQSAQAPVAPAQAEAPSAVQGFGFNFDSNAFKF